MFCLIGIIALTIEVTEHSSEEHQEFTVVFVIYRYIIYKTKKQKI